MITFNCHKLPKQQINYFTKKIISWGRDNYATYPWRSSNNDWHILVAEIMLQRTRADQVVPVYEGFCIKYPDPSAFLKNNDSKTFNSLGLKWRQKNLFDLADKLNKCGIPNNKELLLELPGVGPYISAAYRSLYKGKRDIIIDSNIVRSYGRYFGFKTDSETRRVKWLHDLADLLTPKYLYRDYNYGLIDFTRVICKPKPVCDICVLNKRCFLNQQ